MACFEGYLVGFNFLYDDRVEGSEWVVGDCPVTTAMYIHAEFVDFSFI
jgi:hypothetical protein